MKHSLLIQNFTSEDLKEIISDAVEDLYRSLSDSKKGSPEYLTRKEAASLLHISLPTLSIYTKKGLIKGYRIGTRVLYRQDDVEKSIKEIQSLKYRRA